MLINIIHPYTYKLKEDTLVVGPIEEFEDRDKKVNSLIKKACDSGNKILVHRCHRGNPVEYSMQEAAFLLDPLYERLLELESVVTTPLGIPIPDKKPDQVDEDIWNHFSKIYTSHSQLKEKMSKNSEVIFIGGVIESCLFNFIIYYYDNYRNGEQVFIIPELCVSFDREECNKLLAKLRERKVGELDYYNIVDLISKSTKPQNPNYNS